MGTGKLTEILGVDFFIYGTVAVRTYRPGAGEVFVTYSMQGGVWERRDGEMFMLHTGTWGEGASVSECIITAPGP